MQYDARLLNPLLQIWATGAPTMMERVWCVRKMRHGFQELDRPLLPWWHRSRGRGCSESFDSCFPPERIAEAFSVQNGLKPFFIRIPPRSKRAEQEYGNPLADVLQTFQEMCRHLRRMIDSNAGALKMKPNLILLRVLQGFDGLTHHIIHLTNPCDCNSALSARKRRHRSVEVIDSSNFGGRPSPAARFRFAPSMQRGCAISGCLEGSLGITTPWHFP